MSRQALVGFTTLTLLFLLTPSATKAATLVGGSVYTNVYDGNWVDPLPNRAASWRLSLHAPTVMETSDLIPWPAGQPASTPNDTGNYAPTMLIRNGVVTSGPYSYTATMRTNDDDLFGIIFGYQDSSNYYRVGMRNQSPGSWGGSAGLTVQKVVAGVVTQISPAGTGAGPAVITQSMINNRTPLNVRVDVSGTNYSVFFNDELKASGSDDGLADGQIGLQSWAQNYDSGELPDTRPWGTEADSVTLVDSNGIFSENFSTRNVPWRQVIMTNATGTTNTGNVATTLEPLGNFGNAIGGPWIHQQSNGFVYATTTAPNVDFIGPAVAVDSPGATSWSDYEMQVRIGGTDNDGLGVLVRVQDDNNYYWVNFTNEVIGSGSTRAPRGLSVQKVVGGVWSELYRDDQNSPLFVPPVGIATTAVTGVSITPGQTPSTGLPMFDLKVTALGNTLAIQVIDAANNVINYPLITDTTNPLLTGSVGLATWGTTNVYYSGYGGVADAAMVIEIPEPAVISLAFLACGLIACRNRRRA